MPSAQLPAAPNALSAFICVHLRLNSLAFGANRPGLARHPGAPAAASPAPPPRHRRAKPAQQPLQPERQTIAAPVPRFPANPAPDHLARQGHPRHPPTRIGAPQRRTAQFKPLRTDPMNREPASGAGLGQTARFEPLRTDPMNREPAPNPAENHPQPPRRQDRSPRGPRATAFTHPCPRRSRHCGDAAWALVQSPASQDLTPRQRDRRDPPGQAPEGRLRDARIHARRSVPRREAARSAKNLPSLRSLRLCVESLLSC